MEIYQAVLLGIVEGLTEFLPISSTFHLLFAGQILGLEQTAFLNFFTVFIQAGGILAVLWLYGKELLQDRTVIKNIMLSFLPTALIGFLLYEAIKESFFSNNALMLTYFIVFGLVFIIYEWYVSKQKNGLQQDFQSLSWQQSLLIGLFQAFAIIPGVSRSGIVILGMMLLGQKRASAAKYSFLLAIPTIISTAMFDLAKTQVTLEFSNQEIMIVLVGFLVSFAVAYFVLRWLIQYLQKHSLAIFGYYRIVLGLLLLILL